MDNTTSIASLEYALRDLNAKSVTIRILHEGASVSIMASATGGKYNEQVAATAADIGAAMNRALAQLIEMSPPKQGNLPL